MSQEQEEVLMEVEAVEAVYGDDCITLHRFPPHLHLHIKPRTADVHSQQFVEATIELRAGLQYPSDPPYVGIISSKGLDENRLKHLVTRLRDKVHELASCLMLVALCEEAVEVLTSINHPEGDCPLCLYPLVPEDSNNEAQPFMKLMSCFHCFHCECIVRWLKWIHKQNEADSSAVVGGNDLVSDLLNMMGNNTGNCPLCRKVFLAKDIEHVLNLVGSHDVDSDAYEKELMSVLQCDLETNRRHKYEAILELQQQHGGLIEPPKNNVLFSRLSIQDLLSEVSDEPNGEASEQELTNQIVREERLELSSSSPQIHSRRKHHQRGHSSTPSGTTNRPSGGQHRYYGTRKYGRNYSKTQSNPRPREE